MDKTFKKFLLIFFMYNRKKTPFSFTEDKLAIKLFVLLYVHLSHYSD